MKQIWIRIYNVHDDTILWHALPEGCDLCKEEERVVCEGEPPWPAYRDTPEDWEDGKTGNKDGA